MEKIDAEMYKQVIIYTALHECEDLTYGFSENPPPMDCIAAYSELVRDSSARILALMREGAEIANVNDERLIVTISDHKKFIHRKAVHHMYDEGGVPVGYSEDELSEVRPLDASDVARLTFSTELEEGCDHQYSWSTREPVTKEEAIELLVYTMKDRTMAYSVEELIERMLKLVVTSKRSKEFQTQVDEFWTNAVGMRASKDSPLTSTFFFNEGAENISDEFIVNIGTRDGRNFDIIMFHN